MAPLPQLEVKLALTPEQRVMAYHVIDNIDAFLSKERWLKGGWFKTDSEVAGRNGHHTECLANFIRRVELGGTRENADNTYDDGGSYSQTRSITEGVVSQAIKDLFPGEVRHMHFETDKLTEAGVYVDGLRDHDAGHGDAWRVDPSKCTLNHGHRCATCLSEAYSDEITVGLHYGPFAGEEADEVIPNFNDTLGTRYADVQRVVDRARELVTGIQITNAKDVMTEQERIEVELASIDAQADIDTERLHEWFADLNERGWVKQKWTDREIARRAKRIRMRAEKDKEVVRQDCVNCA